MRREGPFRRDCVSRVRMSPLAPRSDMSQMAPLKDIFATGALMTFPRGVAPIHPLLPISNRPHTAAQLWIATVR